MPTSLGPPCNPRPPPGPGTGKSSYGARPATARCPVRDAVPPALPGEDPDGLAVTVTEPFPSPARRLGAKQPAGRHTRRAAGIGHARPAPPSMVIRTSEHACPVAGNAHPWHSSANSAGLARWRMFCHRRSRTMIRRRIDLRDAAPPRLSHPPKAVALDCQFPHSGAHSHGWRRGRPVRCAAGGGSGSGGRPRHHQFLAPTSLVQRPETFAYWHPGS
jgi:hypothetical protein